MTELFFTLSWAAALHWYLLAGPLLGLSFLAWVLFDYHGVRLLRRTRWGRRPARPGLAGSRSLPPASRC